MIIDVVALIFMVIYTNQYRKMRNIEENRKLDDFLFLMCFISMTLTIAKVFKPLNSLELSLRDISRKAGI